ncbi:MAG: hypothetical protein M3N16_00535 [Actinomycetota bacterium]|nr:hypothetical protein [Actinomycetota bacterium]
MVAAANALIGQTQIPPITSPAAVAAPTPAATEAKFIAVPNRSTRWDTCLISARKPRVTPASRSETATAADTPKRNSSRTLGLPRRCVSTPNDTVIMIEKPNAVLLPCTDDPTAR